MDAGREEVWQEQDAARSLGNTLGRGRCDIRLGQFQVAKLHEAILPAPAQLGRDVLEVRIGLGQPASMCDEQQRRHVPVPRAVLCFSLRPAAVIL
jgi:hypothetical protein